MTFIVGLVAIPLSLALARGLGIYTVPKECQAQVFALFGKVSGPWMSEIMAKAASRRPEVVRQTLNQIRQEDPELLKAVLEVMETGNLVSSGAPVEVLPKQSNLLVQPDGSVNPTSATRPDKGRADRSPHAAENAGEVTQYRAGPARWYFQAGPESRASRQAG